MGWFSNFARSTIGAKYLMGLTGIAMVLFALAHMTGNLLMWAGREAINDYAYGLHQLGHGAVLWIARFGLITVFLVHVITAFQLRARNKAARPVRYARFQPRITSYAARLMIVTGVILLAYIVFHIGHFTVHAGPFESYSAMEYAGKHDVFRMVVTGFEKPAIAIFYIVAMFLMANHLGHGVPSFFQSMGLNHPKYTPTLKKVGKAVSVILFVGFSSVPVGVLAGAITLSA